MNTVIEAFCEQLDSVVNKQDRIDQIDDAIHRLRFERRWRLLSPNQVRHMYKTLSHEAAMAIAAASSESRREALIIEYARSMYFRRCAWISFLNGETDDPPINGEG